MSKAFSEMNTNDSQKFSDFFKTICSTYYTPETADEKLNEENQEDFQGLLVYTEEKGFFIYCTEGYMNLLKKGDGPNFADEQGQDGKVKSQFEYLQFEEVHMVKISAQTLLRYTNSSDIAPEIQKQINQELEKDQWRSNYLLDGDRGMPMICFRNCFDLEDEASPLLTIKSSTVRCDAQAVVTQQMLNYWLTHDKNQNPVGLEFPASEARNSSFSFNGIPFHPYNKLSYNEEISNYVGFIIETEAGQFNDHVNRSKLPEGSVIKLLKGTPYSQIPMIKKRQEAGGFYGSIRDYDQGIMLPLDGYIKLCLGYQLSLDKITSKQREDGTQASDKEIKAVIHHLEEKRPEVKVQKTKRFSVVSVVEVNKSHN
jgi:hypothetical protein